MNDGEERRMIGGMRRGWLEVVLKIVGSTLPGNVVPAQVRVVESLGRMMLCLEKTKRRWRMEEEEEECYVSYTEDEEGGGVSRVRTDDSRRLEC